MVKCVNAPVSCCLGFEVRENFHVDLIGLGQHSQIVCESESTEMYTELTSVDLVIINIDGLPVSIWLFQLFGKSGHILEPCGI